SSALINAAHRFDHKGKGAISNSQFKSSNRQCTFCHRSGHTVDFCYQKHGHPSFNKGKSSVNAANTDVVLPPTNPSHALLEEGSSSGVNSSFSQEQFDQFMAMLQHANLLAPSQSAIPSSSSNQVTITPIDDFMSLLHFEANASNLEKGKLEENILPSAPSLALWSLAQEKGRLEENILPSAPSSDWLSPAQARDQLL
ncbi:hypothetical protein A2U01_0020268, partial [Trifolium medium]|nr:hypothetical protein [Trifolium medium]